MKGSWAVSTTRVIDSWASDKIIDYKCVLHRILLKNQIAENYLTNTSLIY